jgi:hypothetical protein
MASLAVGDWVRVRDKADATILRLNPNKIYLVEAVEVIRDNDGDIPVLRLRGVASPISSLYFERV